MKLKYAGTQIYYTAKGTGNPLVFLHGFLESSKIWEPFLPALEKKRQVVCIDLPGHGETGNLGEIHTMEIMADVVRFILEHLKIDKAGFIGHSMGGYVILALIERFPSLVKNVVLINSTPEEDSVEKKHNRDRAIELLKRNKSAYIKMAISNLTSPENSRIYKKELDRLKKDALQLSEDGIIACLKGMKIRTNKISLLKYHNAPKFMVLGKEDPVMDIKKTKNIGIYCNCKIILTENGHLSYLENLSEIEEIVYFID